MYVSHVDGVKMFCCVDYIYTLCVYNVYVYVYMVYMCLFILSIHASPITIDICMCMCLLGVMCPDSDLKPIDLGLSFIMSFSLIFYLLGAMSGTQTHQRYKNMKYIRTEILI